MDDVDAWLDQLPPEIDAQRRMLARFLAWCKQDHDVRWLTIGCSLERGNADRLSDLDMAIGVKEEGFEATIGRVSQVMWGVGDLVETFDYLMPLDFPLRRFFAQYSDRTQIDLTVGFAPVAYIPRAVVLYDPERAVHVLGDEALDPKAGEVRLWACQGWEALVNVGKYLRRSSLWEALSQLHAARDSLFRMWALAEKVPQARYGVTALVDSGAALPPGIDESLPGMDLAHELVALARSLVPHTPGELLWRLERRRKSPGTAFEQYVAFSARRRCALSRRSALILLTKLTVLSSYITKISSVWHTEAEASTRGPQRRGLDQPPPGPGTQRGHEGRAPAREPAPSFPDRRYARRRRAGTAQGPKGRSGTGRSVRPRSLRASLSGRTRTWPVRLPFAARVRRSGYRLGRPSIRALRAALAWPLRPRLGPGSRRAPPRSDR